MIFLPFIFEKAKYFVLLNIFVPTLSYSTQLIRFTVVNEDLFYLSPHLSLSVKIVLDSISNALLTYLQCFFSMQMHACHNKNRSS